MGDGDAEVFDCATCERPESHCPACPIVDQPVLLREASWYLRLRNRMERYHALPDPGGILDQDEVTLRILDQVEDTVDRYRKWKQKQAGGGQQET